MSYFRYQRKDIPNFHVELDEFLKFASTEKLGCLIVIERKHDLSAIVDTGILMNSFISFQLLQAIFHKGSYLHDGAIIIRDNKIASAGCILPLIKGKMPNGFGTRHRAAMGITDKYDCLAIIVSERSGEIKCFIDGKETDYNGLTINV